MLSADLPVLYSRLGQCSCLLNQAPVTRGSLSCRKMKRQAQAQVLETGDCNPHKIGIKLGFNNLNESKIIYLARNWMQEVICPVLTCKE